MSSIKRFHVAKRLSDMAVYNGVAYLAGQVPDDAKLDITGQTEQVLATIDRLLAEAGTDKTKILMAQIYVANMKEFDGMNKAWDAWVADGNSPPRATTLATPSSGASACWNTTGRIAWTPAPRPWCSRIR